MLSGKIGCNRCGNVYPAYFRFCPIDATELHSTTGSLRHGSMWYSRSGRARLLARVVGLTVIAVILSGAGFMLQALRPRYGQLHVRTSPPGAIIFVDGEQLGTSPIILTDLRSGKHQVRAAMPGYKGTIRYIRIIPDSNEILEWRLEPVEPLPNPQLTQISSSRQRRES